VFNYPNPEEPHNPPRSPAPAGPTRYSAPDEATIQANTAAFLKAVKEAKGGLGGERMGMESQAWDVRQQSVFGKEPEPDIGVQDPSAES